MLLSFASNTSLATWANSPEGMIVAPVAFTALAMLPMSVAAMAIRLIDLFELTSLKDDR